MTGVKANWHIATLSDPDDGVDEFAPIAQAQFEELAEPILLSDVPTLNRRLSDLMARQNTLVSEGRDCELRHREGIVCSACPLQGHYGELCEGSAEIERVLTELTIASGAPRPS